MTDHHPDHGAAADLTDALHLDRETVESGKMIAELDADSAGLLVGLMQRNAEEAARLDDQIRAGIERERDEWKERALWAERQLDGVRRNIERLMIVPEDRDYGGSM